MRCWFTADTHFGHSNIIKLCKRPFERVEIMDEVLIKNWNARVKPHDIVIFLGDFAFRNKVTIENYLSQLNGHITFVKGNHDNEKFLDSKILSLTMNIEGYNIYCVHNPDSFRSKYKINLVGHIHEKWKIQQRKESILVNVGVDQWSFSPISFDEILETINREKLNLK